MESSLIAVTWNLDLLIVILEVAVGLGMVIFVHELGHFAVAKLCGVKCEKFYLGFDIYGLKLCRFRIGETEYGVGILPLGGYVKMLGQDDNPARAADERKRSELPAGEGGGTSSEPALDPRSYLAQSVPKRMAIISAGVIMNILFALAMAVIAYRLGVPEPPCIISEVIPGEAAWRAGMRPADEIVQIGAEPPKRPLAFNDLLEAVAVGDIDDGILFKIKRVGVSEPVVLTVHPDRTQTNNRLKPTIGAVPPRSAQLADSEPAEPHSFADRLDRFKPGDTIVAVNGKPVRDYAHFIGRLADLAGKPVVLTVERKVRGEKTQVKIEVPKHPMRELGLITKMAPIATIQNGSPAAEAGIKAGDRIVNVNGHPVEDPMKLPQQFRHAGWDAVSLTIAREDASGREQLIENKHIKLRSAWWYEEPHPFVPGSPLSIPELGVAYHADNVVARAGRVRYVGKDTSAARLKPGDEIVKAELVPASDKDKQIEEERDLLKPVEFSGKKENWPSFMSRLQWALPSTVVRLTLADKRTVDVRPFDSSDWFNPELGVRPDIQLVEIQAKTWSEAAVMGWRKTRDALLVVYSVLSKLISRQISPLNLGGPIEIGKQAGYAAFEGVSTLLLFLTMLSANLAVINFLPIPLLDGGHMVFLALEGIQGKPVSERVIIAFHYAGFLFIVSLMLFVLSLDFGLISRTAQ